MTVNRWNQYNIKMHETSCIKNPINISIKKTKTNIFSTGQKTKSHNLCKIYGQAYVKINYNCVKPFILINKSSIDHF